MLKHYLQTAFRSLTQQGLYAWINVVGLAIGITLCVLITLFVAQERSYDRHHAGMERIYRIAHEVSVNDRVIRTALTPGPLSVRLAESFPEVESSCRLYRSRRPVAHGENRFLEEGFLFVDPSFLDIFSLRFVAGDGRSALHRPHTVVLTEETAQKYFGDQSPLGKSLVVSGEAYTVTGIVEDLSHRSHLAFNFLAPISSLGSVDWLDYWSSHIFYTYVRLRSGAGAEDFEGNLTRLVNQELGPMFSEAIGKTYPQFLKEGQRFGYFLQPLGGIHLDSNLDFELQQNGNRRVVSSLAALAVLILLIACANYVSLTTARGTKRALEVGLRKALGAERRQLIAQFLVEAMLMTAAAAGLATFLIALLWPATSAYLDREVITDIMARPGNLLLGLTGIVLLGVLAGGYPAFVLSSLQPLEMLRSKGHARGRVLRSAMVVFQFSIAMSILVITLVVHLQMVYLSHKDLGFEPRGVFVINGLSLLKERWKGFKEEALRVPHVVSASAATSVPGMPTLEGYLYPESSTRQEDLVTTWFFEADHDFVRTLGIRLVEGKDLSPSEVDTEAGVLLVSSMVPQRLGWPAPVGRLVTMGKVPANIKGVFDVVYLESLHHPPQETIIRPLLRNPKVMAVRVKEGHNQEVIPQLERIWRRFAPDQPFALSPLDQEIAALYESERRLTRVINGFAMAGIFLACLGIFGLSAFAAEQRTQEIGIRKAIGATAGQIAGKLSSELLVLVILGVLLAVPIAWYFAQRWLESFAVYTQIPWWLFPGTGLLILGIALATVGSQTVRAALANPADTLRFE
jgi:putative ABC transport system permease protein